MIRYAKAKQTIDDLRSKILEKIDPERLHHYNDEDERLEFAILDAFADSQILKDIAKIDVDIENAGSLRGYKAPGAKGVKMIEMLNGIPIAWCAIHGDWEWPVAVALYINDNNKLRAYIPTDGNPYNHEQECAYNDDDADVEQKWKFDMAKLREDVKRCIIVK